jgi:hypothetical protein
VGNRTLVRSDGSKVVVPDAEAQKLLTLGSHREETAGEDLSAGIAQGYEDHYSTPGQQALTAIEGTLSGLSVGLSDIFIDGEGTQDRARYNPGIRLGTELLGGVLPVMGPAGALGRVGAAVRYTPAALLARGAEAAGEALGRGSKTMAALVRGGVEGGGIGIGQAITTAQLTGDPITAESIMAGMGWGALWGGGLSARAAAWP